MAQNRIIKRIIESEVVENPDFNRKLPVSRKNWKTKTQLKYVFGIFKLSGDRQVCESIVEGTYADAVQLTGSNRTESGNTYKGFKKLKSTEA